jgi:hypothetical protein
VVGCADLKHWKVVETHGGARRRAHAEAGRGGGVAAAVWVTGGKQERGGEVRV